MEKSLLTGKKDHLLVLKDWNCRTLIKDLLNLEEKVDYKKKKKFSELLKSETLHEMGEMKRAQELRVHEFSVQKLSESHDTTQRLTSQLQSV